MSARQYMTLLEWTNSCVPSIRGLDIQTDAKENIRIGVYVKKNTYPPPHNWIWACYTIQSFCFEPTGDLLKGIRVVVRIDVGYAWRWGYGHGAVFLLLFLHEFFHPGICRWEIYAQKNRSVKIKYIITTHVFQIVDGDLARPLYFSEKLRIGSCRQETERNK